MVSNVFVNIQALSFSELSAKCVFYLLYPCTELTVIPFFCIIKLPGSFKMSLSQSAGSSVKQILLSQENLLRDWLCETGLKALQPSASSNTPSSSDKEETHNWSHLSGSKRMNTLKFFFRYASVLFSRPGDAQNTELDLTPLLSPFNHRTWPMRSSWRLVRRLKWPISWLCRRRRPNSRRTCPPQSSSRPSPAGQCPSLGAVFGNQGWVGMNRIILTTCLPLL